MRNGLNQKLYSTGYVNAPKHKLALLKDSCMSPTTVLLFDFVQLWADH